MFTRTSHILARKLPVDVDVLSSYVEEVCGQLILNHFVHYMSYGYEGLTMPRSWLIRALMRQSSELSNGKMPYILIPWLRSLLEILVGRLDPGKWLKRHHNAKVLTDYVLRSTALSRNTTETVFSSDFDRRTRMPLFGDA